MQSDDQFHQFMVNNRFRNNPDFHQKPYNQKRIIQYIKKMPINLQSLNIVQNLMKEFSIQILLPLKYFYDKFQGQGKTQLVQKYKDKLARIGILAGCIIKPYKCFQLSFFTIGGQPNKKGGFMVRQKNQQQIRLMHILQRIRVLIKKDFQGSFTEEDNQQRIKIIQMFNKQRQHYSAFSELYVDQALDMIPPYETSKSKLEGSTLDSFQTSGIQEETIDSIKINNTNLNITKSTNDSQNTNNQSANNSSNFSFQKSILTEQSKNLYLQTTLNQKIIGFLKNQNFLIQNGLTVTNENEKTENQLNNQNQNEMLQNKNIQNEKSFNQNVLNNLQQNKNVLNNLQQKHNDTKSDQLQKAQITIHVNKEFSPNKPSTLQSPSETKSTKPFSTKISQPINAPSNPTKQYGPNYSLIPLCCRTFFFDQQRILQSQDKRIQFKSYRFPFSPTSFQTFKKTICSFLNTQGGDIYIGIKETTNKKYRYVLGNYLTQNDKQQVLKAFRRISQNIYPFATNKLDIQFVPIRQSPFKDMSPITQMQVYSFDFTQKPLRLELCPYRPGRYLIRLRVQVGNRDQMYSYLQTQVSLVKNSTTNDFVSIRSQNQVFSKRISQEVLQLYRQKLIYGPEEIKYAHMGPCQKPQIGNIRNEAQTAEDAQESRRIQQIILKNHEAHFKKRIQRQQQKKQETKKQQKPSKAQQMDQNQKIEQNLQKLFQYPLTFIVTNILLQRLQKVIQKTPAKQYSVIQKCENSLTKQQLIIIKIIGYHYMQQFLRIKQKIQRHFAKDKVQFIGITKMLLLQSNENRKIAQHKIKTHNHKCGINNRTLSFYSLIDSASYLLFMKYMGYKIQVILD